MPRSHMGGTTKNRATRHKEAIHLESVLLLGYKELRKRLKAVGVKIPFGASTRDLARLYLANGGAV